MTSHGLFSLVLHSHIPYCKKSGVWPAGEEWLFEAILETYLPLISVIQGWERDDIPGRITIGVVPILAEQLADDYMKRRFKEYLTDKISRAQIDRHRFAGTEKEAMARHWESHYTSLSTLWNTLDGEILGALRRLLEQGRVDLITSAATHGFLPLFGRDSALRAQIEVGVLTFEHHFGQKPKGFWLPECAYRPATGEGEAHRQAVDAWLAEQGIQYFFVESVGVLNATSINGKPLSAGQPPSLATGYTLPSGVSVFARNQTAAKQVWSQETGYPGSPEYLEFHLKDPESGLHYLAVTQSEEKQLYNPKAAHAKAKEHADHFAKLLVDNLSREAAESPILLAPFDTELFGHWWHEGPLWIDMLVRQLAMTGEVTVETPESHLQSHRETYPAITMAPSSWGENGDFTVWDSPEHRWVWPLIDDATKEMEEAVALHRGSPHSPRRERLLQQAGRELLLLQGSDWPFLLYTGQALEYANQRFHGHHQRLQKLLYAAKEPEDTNRLPLHELEEMESKDSPWPTLPLPAFR